MDRVFMKGNEVVAEAAIRAGCRFYAGYPITPQNEISEYFARKMPQVGGVFLQGESEIASGSMLMGAIMGGTRAMTSSSSTGISLMSEAISWMACARQPAVLCNVMRGGPGIGAIQPAQQDYNQATKAHGNGGFRMLVLAPSSAQEVADMTFKAFDLAEQYNNPVMLLLDGVVGIMMDSVVFPDPLSDEWITRNKAEKQAVWAVSGRQGRKEAHFNRPGTGPAAPFGCQPFNQAAAKMYESWKDSEVEYEEYLMEDAELVITAYGTSARFAHSAVDRLREEGYKVGMIRAVKIYPFPEIVFDKLDYGRVRGILSVEMSIPALFAEDVRNAVCRRAPVETCLSSGGVLIKLEDIIESARNCYHKLIRGEKK